MADNFLRWNFEWGNTQAMKERFEKILLEKDAEIEVLASKLEQGERHRHATTTRLWALSKVRFNP